MMSTDPTKRKARPNNRAFLVLDFCLSPAHKRGQRVADDEHGHNGAALHKQGAWGGWQGKQRQGESTQDV